MNDLNEENDKHFNVANSFFGTVTRDRTDIETNLTLLLFTQWYSKGHGDYADGNHRFENLKKIYNLRLNYFFQVEYEEEREGEELLTLKLEHVHDALLELKQIQRYIKVGEWESVKEFHNRNFYYMYADARTDGQIDKDEFFVWLVWELIDMTEDYLDRMDPTGKEKPNDTDRS